MKNEFASMAPYIEFHDHCATRSRNIEALKQPTTQDTTTALQLETFSGSNLSAVAGEDLSSARIVLPNSVDGLRLRENSNAGLHAA